MIVFVNGSFGIGKTTVSRLLVRRLPRSLLFDPEPFGVVLLRLSRPWRWSASPNDFQQLSVWRSTSARLIALLARLRGVVVVPMAFSHLPYLRQFLQDARRTDCEVFHFCLVASLATVRERLKERESRHGATEWQLRRSAECCEAHQRPEFAEHVLTEGRSPQQIAEDILRRVRQAVAAVEHAG